MKQSIQLLVSNATIQLCLCTTLLYYWEN